ncbi:hypothetical protein U1Q18_036859 [Sarracenia purpurea var. burkii]
MTFNCNLPDPRLKSPLTSYQNLAILHKRAFQVREYRVYRRRRLKSNRIFVLSSQFGPLPFENLFQNLVSQFPSVNSLDLIAPALGFTSGVALYRSRLKSNRDSQFSDIGEWILFTSPTPFNRFVMLRCPSISFGGSELLEDVNGRLVKENRHFVKLNSGRIQVGGSEDGDDDMEEKLAYQRVCVSTEDGGVISLDWPANLDLATEHGLDTTILLIPGTAEGSMDKNIRLFVCESLKRGYFPVVMNPRGCAGSPLTTARLFSAADSDDICTAIQFINRARPWTTLMGVGWGYGANMLTKYLAEVGERTPLTAVTCIDNPFDLEEATRSSPHHIALDQKLTGGLVDILRSNKELFRGKAKGFDVEKALLSKSVRDFEQAISMISYGFDNIEEFYAKSSTRCMVGNVKIPLLFIQNDDGTVPLFSIPRSLIEENPFTSLLLCSCLPSRVIARGTSAISWYQHLAIQWLAAVELGLLKGRHPLLNDVDVTINPSKGLALVEGKISDKSDRVNKPLNRSQSNILNGYAVYPLKEKLEESDTLDSTDLRYRQGLHRNSKIGDKGLPQEVNAALEQTSSIDPELAKGEASSSHVERGQVLQTAQVVMNMLDVTMPGTLTEEQKEEVLTAVGGGEIVMKALQDVVPENVRAKLSTAVSEILHNQGTNLKLDGLLNVNEIPNVALGLKSKIQEKVRGHSSAGQYEDSYSSDERKRVDDLENNSNDNQVTLDNPAGGQESELQPSDTLQKQVNTGQSQPFTREGEISSSMEKDNIEWVEYQNEDTSLEWPGQHSDYNENGSDKGAMPDFPRVPESSSGTDDVTRDQHKMDEDSEVSRLDVIEDDNIQQNIEDDPKSSTDQNNTASTKTDHKMDEDSEVSRLDVIEDDNIQQNIEDDLKSSTDQNNTASTKTEEGFLYPEAASEAQPMERVGNDNLNQSSSDSSTFSVSQALQSLTGIDDSTQVAVNSIFGVIEGVITQIEVENDNKTNADGKNKIEDRRTDSMSKNQEVIDDRDSSMRIEENKNDQSSQSDMLDNLPLHQGRDQQNDARTRWAEMEKSIRSPDQFEGNSVGSSSEDGMVSHINKAGSGMREHLVSNKLLAEQLNKIRHFYDMPLFITTNPYNDPIYKEYFYKYVLSKMPNTKLLDLDKTTALFLDYIPEEEQWKFLEQSGNKEDSADDVSTREGVNKVIKTHSPSIAGTDEVIEPPYIIMDAEQQKEPIRDYDTVDKTNQKVVIGTDSSQQVRRLVKTIILGSLKVEVGRRLSAGNMKDLEPNLAGDMEHVANAVSLAASHSKNHIWFLDDEDYNSEKLGILNGECIVSAITSAVQETNYLRSVLPVGVVVGSNLAALRKFFDVVTVSGIDQSEFMALDQINHSVVINHVQLVETEVNQVLRNQSDQKYSVSKSRDGEKTELRKRSNDTIMVGAVTAALGASALLVHQQDSDKGTETSGTLFNSFEEKVNHQKEHDKLDEEISEKNPNVVTSLAEKAISVAGPVVPKKEGGEVDQERLVAMLAELGQKGGMLKLFGKIALLWGGMRGAMSLTDRLILILRIAERPLVQRILAFVCMVLVLWSPIVLPLLPTLVQSWATHNSSETAELICIIGLYSSIIILVMLWGKRIRGYEHPFEQYGLDFTSSSKIKNFLKGLIGGVMLILSIHSLNVLLGCARLSWPSTVSLFSSVFWTWIKVYGKLLLLVGQGIVTATGIALVEELLFRAWLPDEIATDLGYYQGIIISGLAFSLFQRSPWAIPGLWLLSIGLAGARERSEGSLSIPIGLRAGIIASNFVLQKGGFLRYQSIFPRWITGIPHPFQPFGGMVGLAFSLLFAIVLRPRQQPLHQTKTTTQEIRE